MSENIVPRCVSITMSRTQAIASINPSEEYVRIISCSNGSSCQSRGLLNNGCPPTCQIVSSAKRYSQERRVRADIDEVNPEKLDQIVEQSGVKALETLKMLKHPS